MSEQEKQGITLTDTIKYADDLITIDQDYVVEHIDLSEEFRKLCKLEHREVFALEQNRITQENRNLKDNIFELERRLTSVINLNDRYEHLLMQITLEMNSLKKDNYILKLKLADLMNVHEAQMTYLKMDNDELNIKLKNIHGFHQTILKGF